MKSCTACYLLYRIQQTNKQINNSNHFRISESFRFFPSSSISLKSFISPLLPSYDFYLWPILIPTSPHHIQPNTEILPQNRRFLLFPVFNFSLPSPLLSTTSSTFHSNRIDIQSNPTGADYQEIIWFWDNTPARRVFGTQIYTCWKWNHEYWSILERKYI